MEFKYEALDQNGKTQSGVITATTQDSAINSLQKKGFTITSLSGSEAKGLKELLNSITFFGGVSSRDLVILSRQISTLFEAQVSALRVFRLLSEQEEKPFLRNVLVEVSDDLQGGVSLSKAFAKHQSVFSDFYVNMVRSGEESGKLDQTFTYLADYTDRTYELSSKARNALIYPAFILVTFITVMLLMMTLVMPQISTILVDSGQTLPVFTQIVLGISSFIIDYGIFMLIALIVGGYFIYRYAQTKRGSMSMSRIKLALPYIGTLYQKLYLSRISDNMHVMLSSGISAVRSLEITASVVENDVYNAILNDALENVKAGTPISQTLNNYPHDIPSIMVQMFQIGEETGELQSILERMAKFYSREVNSAVDTLVSLIEPAFIVLLALGVGVLLASVLLPIYNSVSSM